METHGPLSFEALQYRPYHPKCRVRFDVGKFTVKTVTEWWELQELLRLRHAIFHVEHHDRVLPSGMDIDETDFVCDHLIIRDNRAAKIIGSYRLTSTAFADRFYADRRFELEGILCAPGIKLELGRACVDPAYRNGITLNLLWRGIGEYLKATGATHLFGSASIRTGCVQQVAGVWRRLQADHRISDAFSVRPKAEAEVPGLDLALAQALCDPLDDAPYPPLFRAYLAGGAKVVCRPAVDSYMGSVDFLTVLSVDEMSERLRQRYRDRG